MAKAAISMFVVGCVLMVGAVIGEAGSREDGARCLSDCDCTVGSICWPNGRCNPILCPLLYDPVCGVDGKTYPNRCEARAAHVAVAHKGVCDIECGGLVGALCPRGMVCELPVGTCNTPDQIGKCVPWPEVCPYLWEPVCGCDGQTYANDCIRIRSGVQKEHDGKCKGYAALDHKVPERCFTDEDCPKSWFCEQPMGECAAETGQCAPVPDACIQVYVPVCGCDGVTYSNACFAAMARQSILFPDECETAFR